MKIVIPTCDKYVETIHPHVHFLRKLWPACPYEVLVVVGGKALVPHADEIDATIAYLGEDRLWASNFLRTHEMYLQEDEFFILLMDDLIPYFLLPSAVQHAVDTIAADANINQIRLAERWVKRPIENPRSYYGEGSHFVEMRKLRHVYSNKATLWRSSVHRKVLKAGETSTRTEGNGTGRLRDMPGLNLGVTEPTLEQLNWITRNQKTESITEWIGENW